jgi:hypothetical protein
LDQIAIISHVRANGSKYCFYNGASHCVHAIGEYFCFTPPFLFCKSINFALNTCIKSFTVLLTNHMWFDLIWFDLIWFDSIRFCFCVSLW